MQPRMRGITHVLLLICVPRCLHGHDSVCFLCWLAHFRRGRLQTDVQLCLATYVSQSAC